MDHKSAEYIAAKQANNEAFLSEFRDLLAKYRAEFIRSEDGAWVMDDDKFDSKFDSNGELVGVGVDIELPSYIALER